MSLRFDAKSLILIVIIAVTATVYAALNTRFSFEFKEVDNFLNYNQLAEVALEGRLHLNQPLHPERVKAEDPADPSLPYPYLLDAVVFDGKYYFLQEPLPAVFHAIWMKLFGSELPTGVALIGISIASFLVLGAIIRLIKREFFPESDNRILTAVWWSFAFCATQLYIISRPVVYNEAIAVGAFFVLCSAYYFVRCVVSNNDRASIALCGLFSGAAVLCRLTLIVYSIVFFFGLAYSLKRNGSIVYFLKSSVIYGLCVALFVSCLLIYNYARFDDPLDFGRKNIAMVNPNFYQYCIKQGHYFRAAHVPHNLETYFLSYPELLWRHNLPWVRFTTTQEFRDGIFVSKETVCSIFLMIPLLIFAFPLPSLVNFRADPRVALIPVAFFAGSLSMFGVLLFFVTAQARYLYDFTPLLFVVAAFNLLHMREHRFRRHPKRFELAVGTVIALTVIMGMYVGVNGMVQWR